MGSVIKEILFCCVTHPVVSASLPQGAVSPYVGLRRSARAHRQSEVRANIMQACVPEGFQPFTLDEGFVNHVGPLYWRIDGEVGALGFVVQDHHMNPAGVCHGGMMMTVMDMAVGFNVQLAAKTEAFSPTIQMSYDFLKPAFKDQWLVSEIDFKYPYLFVPRKAVGVNVIDMSDPKRPKLLPPIAPIHHDLAQRNLEWSDGVYVWGDRLYVADYRTGLKVINIADIRNPKFEFHYLDLMWANYSYSVSVDGFGRYIYNGGIGIVDFIEVSSPSETPKGEVTIRLVK